MSRQFTNLRLSAGSQQLWRKSDTPLLWKITHRENVFPSAANVAFSNRIGGARPPEIRETGKARKMDALLIGAPLGLGLLLALGGVMVVMSYLSQ